MGGKEGEDLFPRRGAVRRRKKEQGETI